MMVRGAAGRIRFLLACAALVGILWVAPTAGLASSGQRVSPGASKISPVLGQALERMTRAGVSRSTMGAHDLEQFSDALVRVDPRGRVQVYIHLDRLDDEVVRDLEAVGVTIELTNPGERVVQGWVPFYLVEDVARLVNVRRMRPPDYAVPRSRRVGPREESQTGVKPR